MNEDSGLRRWLRSTRQGFNLLEVAVAVTLLSTLSAGAGATALHARAEYAHSNDKTTLQSLVGAISMDAGARGSLFNPNIIPLYAEGGRNAVENVKSITVSPIAQSTETGEVAAVISEDRQVLSMAMLSSKDRCLRTHTVNGVASAVTSHSDGPCRPLLPDAVLSDSATDISQTASALTAMQISAGRIQFDWVAVEGASAYLLSVDGTGQFCTETAPKTSCILEFPAGTYTAQVDAQNAAGFAPTSQKISFSVSTAPESPFLTGSAEPAKALLSWEEPANNGATISSYLVEFQRDGASIWRSVPVSDPSVRTLELKPLEAGLYRFRISAENALGFSPVSETMVLDVPELEAPTVESADADADGVVLDYSVSDDQETDGTEYSTDGGETWQPLPEPDNGDVNQTFATAGSGQLFLANRPTARGLDKALERARERAMDRAANNRVGPLAERLTAPACASAADLRTPGRSGQAKEARCSIRTGSDGRHLTPGEAQQIVLRVRLGDVVSPASNAIAAAPLQLPLGLIGYAAPAGDGTVDVPSSFSVLSGQSVTFEADGTRIYRITSLLHPQSENAGELLEHRIARNGTDIQGSVTDRKHLDLFRTDPVFGYVTRQRVEPRSRQETYQSGTRPIYEDRWQRTGGTYQMWEQTGWRSERYISHYRSERYISHYRSERYISHYRSERYISHYTRQTHYRTEWYSYNCGTRWRPRTCWASRRVVSHHTWHPVYATRSVPVYATRSVPVYATRSVPVYATRQVAVHGWVTYPSYGWVTVHVRNEPVYSTRTVHYTETVNYQNWEQVATRQVKTGTKLNTNVKTDSLVTFDVPSAGTVTYATRARISAGAGVANADRAVQPVLLIEDMGPASGAGQVPDGAPAAGVVAVESPSSQSTGFSSAGMPVPGQSVTFQAQEGRRYMIVSSARPLSQQSGNTATHQIRRTGASQPLASAQVTLPNRANSANSTIVAYDVPGAGTVTYGTHLAFNSGAATGNANFADQVNRPLIAVIDVGPADTLPLARVSRFPSGLAAAPVQGSAATVTSAGERLYRIDVVSTFTSATENDRVRLELIRESGSDQKVIQRALVVASRGGAAATGHFSAVDFPPVAEGEQVTYRVRAIYEGSGSGRSVSTVIAVDDLGLGASDASALRSVLAPLR